jgi:hypothetical protein
VTTGGPSLDPPVYRPFALLAFAAILLLGAPLGMWLLMRPAGTAASLIWLHAVVQLFGFLATLIVGVAHHLLPRFTGRAVRPTALTSWLFAGLAAALVLRVAGAMAPEDAGATVVASVGGALVHTITFASFAAWVWRTLDPPPLRLVRVQLTLSSAWLAAAAALETWLRVRSRGVPDAAGMQVVYAMALAGGVLGWVLGVLLRAGPMFVGDWRVPTWLARATPGTLALSVGLTAASAAGAPSIVARAADMLAVATVAAVMLAAGALRRSPRALPMLSRSVPEARIFRVAVASSLAASVLALWALALGPDAPRALTDAIRHLVAIGVVGAIVIAMTFRLIPPLEGRPLPWPGLRSVALWTLAGALVLRTSQVLVPLGWHAVTPLVGASAVLAWAAFACAGSSFVSRPPTGASGPVSTEGRT